MAPARIQPRKSWSLKVKNDRGLAWSVWKIAKNRSMKCKKSGQRWVCTAKAKPCLYVVQQAAHANARRITYFRQDMLSTS